MDWLQQAVHGALERHGVSFAVAEDGSAILENGFGIYAKCEGHTDHGHSHVLRCDFVFFGGQLNDRVVLHCLAGVGNSIEQAQTDGIKKFLTVAFHTVLETLGNHSCDTQQVEWETWEGDSGKWRAGLSPFYRMASGQFPQISLTPLLDALRDAFLAQPRDGAHLMDIYFANQGGRELASELRLNGEAWPEGEATLRNWNKPSGDGYYSGRMVAVLSPV